MKPLSEIEQAMLRQKHFDHLEEMKRVKMLKEETHLIPTVFELQINRQIDKIFGVFK